jgi:hypothetical protein
VEIQREKKRHTSIAASAELEELQHQLAEAQKAKLAIEADRPDAVTPADAADIQHLEDRLRTEICTREQVTQELEKARQELAQIESKVMQSQTVQVDEIEELKKKLALEMEARDDAERRAVEATVLHSLAHHTHC